MNLAVWMGARAAEFRHALRMIWKAPGASAVTVLSLALGIGANTAVFSLVDAVLLKSLPVKSPQELYLVASNPLQRTTAWPYPDYVAFRDHNSSFSGLAAYSTTQPVGLRPDNADSSRATELVHALIVSGNYFEVLGVAPAAGRLFNPEDDRMPGGSPCAVLSHDYWRRRFNGDPGLIGRGLRLNGHPFTVVGVAPRGFRGADVSSSPDLFVPVMMRSEVTGTSFAAWNNRHHWWIRIIGRLKSGASIGQAESELHAVFSNQAEAERRTASDTRSVNPVHPVVLMPAARGFSILRNRLEKPLFVLMAAVGLVLLIACANVANLMLARGVSRQRELALRRAIGASRLRLTCQLMIESVVIALLGGAAGLLLSFLGVSVLLEFVPQPPGWNQATIHVSPDTRLLVFAFAVSMLTAVLFGVVPALRATRPDLVPALKNDAPGATGSPRRLRDAIVVGQVALSLLLLIGAALFVRSLSGLRDIDPGFRRDHTVIIFVNPGQSGYQDRRLRDFYERLRAQVEALPGVQSVSLAQITPLEGMEWNGFFAAEGYQWKPGDPRDIKQNAVGPRFFETVGISILLGRDFRDEDNPAYSSDPVPSAALGARQAEPPGPRVAIINESTAKRFYAGRSPVGMHVCLSREYDAGRAYEIVGVVKDARYYGLREAFEPMVYLPVWRSDLPFKTLCVRSTLGPPQIIDGVRRQVTGLDPAVPVLSARTLRQQIDNDILEERLIATLSGFFGFLALLLAGVGLYGVLAHSATRRTREIGVRMALGAPRSAVLWLVIRDAALLVAVGAAIGVVAALALTRLVRAFLYGIGAQDPLSIAAGILVLLAAAVLASFLPARRAAKVEPLIALRCE